MGNAQLRGERHEIAGCALAHSHPFWLWRRSRHFWVENARYAVCLLAAKNWAVHARGLILIEGGILAV